MPTVQSDELRTLTDSINGNANVARTVIALLLLLALYLFLTLVASTDKNLLLDGQVLLPQLGVGLAVSISYVLAPPVFLYLHLHAMLVLATLTRQMRTFDALVRPGDGQEAQAYRAALGGDSALAWNWLSAFPFIQMYVPNSGMAVVSLTLVWLTVSVIPLLLLIAIDLSFLRYQSWPITLFHHSILVLDFLVVQHFLTRFQWGLARCSPTRQLRALLVRYLRRLVTPPRVPWVYGALKRVRYAPSLCTLLLIAAYAHPPSFDLATVDNDRARIWGEPMLGFWSSALSGHNILDAGPCEWWGLGCRYLDVREGQPVAFDGSSVSDAASSPEGRHGLERSDLARRDFRFARIHSVRLAEADLRHTDLRGAELDGSILRRADLSDADLTGARLRYADLQGANLHRAKFNAVNLYKADLRGAQMSTAQFMGADLHRAQLAGADMSLTCLAGSRLMSAGLQGVNLGGAYLQGADLTGAMLHGANITRAKLHGVSFGLAVLDGANLRQTDVSFTTGFPASLYLTVLDDVTFDTKTEAMSTDYPSDTLCPDLWTHESASHPGRTIEEHFKNQLEISVNQRWKGQDWNTIRNKNNDMYPGPTSRFEGRPYWQKMRKWTADFACRNQFTALGTLRRWQYRDMMDGLDVPSAEWRSVRESLASQRRSKHECLGLASLPERLWEAFMLDWN